MEKKETPEEIAARISQAMTKGHIDSSADFINNVLSKELDSRPRVPENVFSELFLPHLAGTSKDDGAGMHNAIAHWTGLVGGGSEVDLVDPAGNVVAVVPALFDPALITNRYSSSLSRIVENAQIAYSQDARVLPARATAEMAAVSAEIIDQTFAKNEQAVENNIQAWKKLYAHFGLLPKTEVSSDPQGNTDIPDDFQFS